jgi:hypothetical protein
MVAPAPAPKRHRVTFGVDIEGYSKRLDPEQFELQARLCWVTEQALKGAGVKPRKCERQNQGDGQLISLPAAVDMQAVLPALPRAMQAALYQVNSVPGPAGRMRMRMAIAQGPLQQAAAGYVGPGVIAASRMLDSQMLRDELRQAPGADLVLMVSDDLYRQVYRHGYGGLAAGSFRSAFVDDPSGKFTAHVWIYVPSGPPDTKLVKAFTGVPAAGDPAALWDVAIPLAGIGAGVWLGRHTDHPQSRLEHLLHPGGAHPGPHPDTHPPAPAHPAPAHPAAPPAEHPLHGPLHEQPAEHPLHPHEILHPDPGHQDNPWHDSSLHAGSADGGSGDTDPGDPGPADSGYSDYGADPGDSGAW